MPLAGLIDVEKELAKLTKEQTKVEGELKRIQGKLANEKFVANAPEEVVAKEKVAELTATLAKLKESAARLAELR